ncbi:hypothetical protein NQ317_009355 [Molorchus minor]|uniref:MADF domain-containing protein n=1 Tax=Molorchus minor TaxID=1323400 RepID=A0ABQ9JLW5_9CUCU|nr:hypothetical protein NQ317_009355 [Molorchus minor]
MDLLDQPEVKKTYEKCKYIVKVWEHKFVKQHNRLPSKLDIREATIEVRHAYRKYFQIKTTALEQSFVDVEGFEDEQDDKTIDKKQIEETEPNNTNIEKLHPTG